MSGFAVVTDSTADLPADIARRHGIRVVPLTVAFGTETFDDGVLSQPEFFERMKAAPALPTTSQPPIGVFVDAFSAALESADSVLSIHISSKLSGTVESARAAAERFGDRVHVFDSLNLSWALAFQAIEAARAAADGVSVAGAIERLERLRDRVRLIIGLDSLENLARGGRIGNVSAFLGSLLNLKVTFMVDSAGSFQPLARVRGEKAALKQTLDWVTEQMGEAVRGRFAVGHVMSEDRAHWLAEQLQARFEAVEMYVYEAGSVIATHTGTGWGVAVVPEPS